MRRWFFIILPIILPLASAQWLVSVDSNPISAELFVVATSPGCVYVLGGRVLGLYELNGNSFVPEQPSDVICTDGGVFRIDLSGDAYVSFPSADFVIHKAIFSSVQWKNYPGHSFLFISPEFLPLLLLVTLLGFVVFAYFRRRGHAPKQLDTTSKILAYVAEHPGCTQKDICNALGLEKYQVSRILSRLEKDGKIIRVRRGISKRVYLPDQLQ